jgi:cadherin domain-containing protein/hemolysin type calcium-binding protein
MAGSANSQQNPGSQNARLPVGNEASDAADSEADALFLSVPTGADRSVYRVFPDQIIGAQFPATAANALLEGADLVLAFSNGGSITLTGFLIALQAENPPQLIFEDGAIFTLPDHVARAAPAPEDAGLSVASGPGDQAPGADPGVPAAQNLFERDQGYGHDFGGLSEGLQASGTLSPPGFGPADQAAGSDGARLTPPPASDLVSFEPSLSQAQIQAQAQAQAQSVASNRPPSGISLSGNSVDELIFVGIPVGIVTATDPDPGDNLTYSLSDNAGGRFAINAVSGLISTALPLDFEAAASHTITVRATDSAGATTEESFTIAVNDLNEISGGAGADILAGTAQTDVIDGQDGDDQISGGDGNDVLLGGIGRDVLNGDGGNDFLFGEASNDTLDGGAGADQLFGGSGNDILLIDANDTFIDGGAGTDRVNVQGAGGVTLNMTSSSIELAFGGAGDDIFDATGSSANIRQDGDGGNDTLTGGNGGDRLRGVGGADTLSGGPGNDTLDGGAQNDSLTGGAGADVFIFNLTFAGGLFTAEGSDTIADLTTGDILSFRGVVDVNGDTAIDLADLIGHVSVASAGGTTTLSFDGGGSIGLEGLAGPFASLADLTAAGFTLEGLA